MHHAQPSAKRLAIALGHWRERAGCSPSGGAISVAAAAALAHARARPDTLAYVSGHHPVVQALRRALAQDVPPPTPACRHPLPSCLSLADALSQAALRRGRTDQDLPRARAARVSELAAAIGSSPVLSAGVAPTARAAWQLAAEWAEIFERWDWLMVAWVAEGAPTAVAVDLTDVTPLVSLYQACWDPNDPAMWFESHPPHAAEPTSLLWCGVHPLDLVDQARVQVAWPGRWQAVWVEPNPSALALADVWPDVRDLQLGLPPAPAQWDPPAIRSRALALGVSSGQLSIDCRSLEGSRLEACAGLAVEVLNGWLQEGRTALGVVPADRQMARRVAAGLLAHGVQIDDLSGWSLDTTLAATAFEGLVHLLERTTSRDQFLGWLNSPLVLEALEGVGMLAVADLAAIDRRLRRHASGPLDLSRVWPELAEQVAALAAPLGRAKTVCDWITQLENALRQIGLEAVFLRDAAGLRLIGGLRQLALDLSQEPPTRSTTQAALADTLRTLRLPIRADGARVRIVSLAEAALAGLDGLILLGASEGKFPARLPNRLVSRGRRDSLFCLPDQGLEEARFVSNLAEVLARGVSVVAIAQQDAEDQPATWAAAISRLHLLMPAMAPRAAHPLPLATTMSIAPARPPAIELAGLPPEIGVSTLQSLPSCPYRFHWQAVLGLSTLSPMKDLAGPADLGMLLHRLSEAVGEADRDPPTLPAAAQSSVWLAWLEVTLTQLAQNRAWSPDLLVQARPLLPGFADWLADTAKTHDLVGLEQDWVADLPLSGIRVRGRSDRIDAKRGGRGLRLIDLKITAAKTLRQRLRSAGGALQVQAYTWLVSAAGLDRPVEQGCLSVSWTGAAWVPCSDQPGLINAADDALLRLAHGQPVRALAGEGDGTSCKACPAKGCCRVQDWGQL